MNSIVTNSSRAFDRAVRAGNPAPFERDGCAYVEVCLALSPGRETLEDVVLSIMADQMGGCPFKRDSRGVGIYLIPQERAGEFRDAAFGRLDALRAEMNGTQPVSVPIKQQRMQP